MQEWSDSQKINTNVAKQKCESDQRQTVKIFDRFVQLTFKVDKN